MISHTQACTPATSIVIDNPGGLSVITFWDYGLSYQEETVFVNGEPVKEIQVAPPFVLLITEGERKFVVVDESNFRERAAAAGILLPHQPD
jgi:hypothetical protein